MTLSSVFRADGVPCLISDFLVTSDQSKGIDVSTYPQFEKMYPDEKFKISNLLRKAMLISPNLLVAGSGNGHSAQRIFSRLLAIFGDRKVTRDDLEDAFSQMDDIKGDGLACVIVGWIVDGPDPISFRWNSSVPYETAYGRDFTEGSGKAIYERLSKNTLDARISPSERFEGAAQFCLLRTAPLWANELLNGSTLANRFGVGYDIYIYDNGEFRLLEEVVYLLFRMEFLNAEDGVTYRTYTLPVYTKQFYIDDTCLVRVFLTPNMMGICERKEEGISIIRPMLTHSTSSSNSRVPFAEMALTAPRYAVCWVVDSGTESKIYPFVGSGTHAEEFRIYRTGNRDENGLEEIRFELPISKLQNMVTDIVSRLHPNLRDRI